MTHSGINSQILDKITEQAITRLKVVFVHNTGHEKEPIGGTAFWIKTKEGEDVLVTNKHNVFPEMKDAKYKGYKVASLSVQLRKKNKGGFDKETKFFEIDLENMEGFVHTSADVALIFNPTFKDDSTTNNNGCFGYSSILYSNIADENWIVETTSMLDAVAFIGYPKSWYDDVWELPIARKAEMASGPKKSFDKKGITSDVTLVTGLSFGGSSGSPVIILPKGIQAISVKTSSAEGGTENFTYIPAKVVGIMSGHLDWVVVKAKEDLLTPHSGLSYFTRSSTILEMLEGKNREIIENYIILPIKSCEKSISKTKDYPSLLQLES